MREKYCSLAEKVWLISQTNRAVYVEVDVKVHWTCLKLEYYCVVPVGADTASAQNNLTDGMMMMEEERDRGALLDGQDHHH